MLYIYFFNSKYEILNMSPITYTKNWGGGKIQNPRDSNHIEQNMHYIKFIQDKWKRIIVT